MELGMCESEPFAGQPSWVDRMTQLRDTIGPFRLAYLETLLRAADTLHQHALHQLKGSPYIQHDVATLKGSPYTHTQTGWLTV